MKKFSVLLLFIIIKSFALILSDFGLSDPKIFFVSDSSKFEKVKFNSCLMFNQSLNKLKYYGKIYMENEDIDPQYYQSSSLNPEKFSFVTETDKMPVLFSFEPFSGGRIFTSIKKYNGLFEHWENFLGFNILNRSKINEKLYNIENVKQLDDDSFIYKVLGSNRLNRSKINATFYNCEYVKDLNDDFFIYKFLGIYQFIDIKKLTFYEPKIESLIPEVIVKKKKVASPESKLPNGVTFYSCQDYRDRVNLIRNKSDNFIYFRIGNIFFTVSNPENGFISMYLNVDRGWSISSSVDSKFIKKLILSSCDDYYQEQKDIPTHDSESKPLAFHDSIPSIKIKLLGTRGTIDYHIPLVDFVFFDKPMGRAYYKGLLDIQNLSPHYKININSCDKYEQFAKYTRTIYFLHERKFYAYNINVDRGFYKLVSDNEESEKWIISSPYIIKEVICDERNKDEPFLILKSLISKDDFFMPLSGIILPKPKLKTDDDIPPYSAEKNPPTIEKVEVPEPNVVKVKVETKYSAEEETINNVKKKFPVLKGIGLLDIQNLSTHYKINISSCDKYEQIAKELRAIYFLHEGKFYAYNINVDRGFYKLGSKRKEGEKWIISSPYIIKEVICDENNKDAPFLILKSSISEDFILPLSEIILPKLKLKTDDDIQSSSAKVKNN